MRRPEPVVLLLQQSRVRCESRQRIRRQPNGFAVSRNLKPAAPTSSWTFCFNTCPKCAITNSHNENISVTRRFNITGA